MFIRKIGKFLRGNSTPFQIFSATVLGGLVGSLPGITQGPLLVAFLLVLLIVLNANLFLFGLVLLASKLVTLLLLPFAFRAGIWLLEDVANGLVSVLANAPVTAWFGLEYYVMIPSLVIGALVGVVFGCMVHRSMKSFRHRMAGLEEGSERYQAYTQKWWVRSLGWLLIGGIKGKQSWKDLEDKRKGLPVRPLGILLVILCAVLGFVGLKFLDRTIVTAVVRDNLEAANGATVDLDSVQILATDNRILLSGLAMADPENLSSNRFSSKEITADLSGFNLLKKKVVIDTLRIVEPRSGSSRRVPGKVLVKVPSPEPEPETEVGDVIDIDGYLGQASVWRERLRTIKRFYERVAPYLESEDSTEDASEETLSWREQLVLKAKEQGYAKVKSASLVSDQPRLWIREILADQILLDDAQEHYAIEASNISTEPALLEKRGNIQVKRKDGSFTVGLRLPSRELPNTSSLMVRYGDIDIRELEQSSGRDLPMKGGTMDVEGQGSITGGIVDLPLKVTLHDTTIEAFGSSLEVDQLPLQVKLSGPIDQLSLDLPEDAIEEAIKAGGRRKVEQLIEEKAGDKLKGLLNLGG